MMNTSSRRAFIKTSLRSGLAVAGLGWLATAARAADPIRRIGAARFRTSLAELRGAVRNALT